MSAALSRQAVIEAWQAFASRDPERIAAVFAEDAEWLAPPGNATARAMQSSHHMIGRARIAHFIAVEFGTLFCSDVESRIHGMYADGDTVVVEQSLSATLSNGRHYENDYCLVFEIENGLIRRVREYMDTARGHRAIFGSA